jgi:8-oxo-dGTP pyrophosphatase MutT (NUDIX family)
MQTKSIKPLRLSASLILSLGDSAEDKNKFLMLIRKPHMSFENSLVFPGGVCDAEDEKMSASFA